MKTPQVTHELVSYLESVFPDRCPDPETPEREVWMAAGAAKVVRKLRVILNKQVEASMLQEKT